jgi:hypothetical protein
MAQYSSSKILHGFSGTSVYRLSFDTTSSNLMFPATIESITTVASVNLVFASRPNAIC